MAGLSPEAAARRGRTLLNLRCTEVEAGLLGRTLITLINNKVRVLFAIELFIVFQFVNILPRVRAPVNYCSFKNPQAALASTESAGRLEFRD